MNKPLEQLNLEELKALTYDQLIELNRVQKNIQILEARIAEVSKTTEQKAELDRVLSADVKQDETLN